MNQLFEIGMIITICLISASLFVDVFGTPGELNVIGYTVPTPTSTNPNIVPTQDDINAMTNATGGIIKSGEPFDTSPGQVAMWIPGIGLVLAGLINVFAGYSQFLYAALPISFHPIVTIITAIFSFIQAVTILYFIMIGLSLLRGGGFGG